jgi:flagellar biosynthesis chaperone FliJ
MNLQTVITNLKNTIAGKEKYLAQVDSALAEGVASSQLRIALSTTQEFLQINIAELKRILADVEKCVAKDVEQSWRDNPDRSGGQFTQDEIDNASAWR